MTRSKIRTSGAEGLTLSSTDITIASGDLLFGTSAKGVNLGVTSNTDGNTLDDFEEGTWTPTLHAGGSNLGIVGTSTYVKIGRQVTVKFDILSMDSTNGSGFQRRSLPFTVGANLSTTGSCMFQNINTTSGTKVVVPYVNGNATYNRFYECGDNISYRQLLGNEFGTSFRAITSITYFVD